MAKNLMDSIMGTDGGDLNIHGIATYQPFDGLMELKAIANFKSQVVGRAVLFDSLQMAVRAESIDGCEKQDRGFPGFSFQLKGTEATSFSGDGRARVTEETTGLQSFFALLAFPPRETELMVVAYCTLFRGFNDFILLHSGNRNVKL
ncbi:hypothetical protein GH714_026593 [Hevea brasiliensis]|uniref:Uncharacterized protein n=1 Tax=Hevea brasiliensis TaxID=3981 RepID=A0A6A6MES6_HEVBR|nr:hypothetical protein GH714_026593 [Hevea brasiliensis]